MGIDMDDAVGRMQIKCSDTNDSEGKCNGIFRYNLVKMSAQNAYSHGRTLSYISYHLQ